MDLLLDEVDEQNLDQTGEMGVQGGLEVKSEDSDPIKSNVAVQVENKSAVKPVEKYDYLSEDTADQIDIRLKHTPLKTSESTNSDDEQACFIVDQPMVFIDLTLENSKQGEKLLLALEILANRAAIFITCNVGHYVFCPGRHESLMRTFIINLLLAPVLKL